MTMSTPSPHSASAWRCASRLFAGSCLYQYFPTHPDAGVTKNKAPIRTPYLHQDKVSTNSSSPPRPIHADVLSQHGCSCSYLAHLKPQTAYKQPLNQASLQSCPAHSLAI